MRDYAWRIERLLWWKKRGFHTLLQNVSLADRQLNATSKMPFPHTGQVHAIFLDDPGVIKGEFTAQADVASLLIFRNGLWPNRDVAHTRFHTLPTPRFSHGIMYNLSIEEGGIIHTKHHLMWIYQVVWNMLLGKFKTSKNYLYRPPQGFRGNFPMRSNA